MYEVMHGALREMCNQCHVPCRLCKALAELPGGAWRENLPTCSYLLLCHAPPPADTKQEISISHRVLLPLLCMCVVPRLQNVKGKRLADVMEALIGAHITPGLHVLRARGPEVPLLPPPHATEVPAAAVAANGDAAKRPQPPTDAHQDGTCPVGGDTDGCSGDGGGLTQQSAESAEAVRCRAMFGGHLRPGAVGPFLEVRMP